MSFIEDRSSSPSLHFPLVASFEQDDTLPAGSFNARGAYPSHHPCVSRSLSLSPFLQTLRNQTDHPTQPNPYLDSSSLPLPFLFSLPSAFPHTPLFRPTSSPPSQLPLRPPLHNPPPFPSPKDRRTKGSQPPQSSFSRLRDPPEPRIQTEVGTRLERRCFHRLDQERSDELLAVSSFRDRSSVAFRSFAFLVLTLSFAVSFRSQGLRSNPRFRQAEELSGESVLQTECVRPSSLSFCRRVFLRFVRADLVLLA